MRGDNSQTQLSMVAGEVDGKSPQTNHIHDAHRIPIQNCRRLAFAMLHEAAHGTVHLDIMV